MSVFADGYSSYLNYTFNYVNKFNTFNSFFEEGYNICKDTNFLTKNFINKIEDFPIFPYFYNILSGVEYVKITNIYNVSMDEVEYLEETLLSNPSIIRQKTVYNLIPERIDDILQYAYFQYAYMSDINDLYNVETNFRSFMFERTYRNFFNSLYSNKFCSVGEAASAGIENSCFTPLYAIRNFLFNLMFSSCNFPIKLLNYLTYFNVHGPAAQRIDNSNLAAGFTSFITTYKTTMSTEIADLISKSIYNYHAISLLMKNDILDIVRTKLTELPTIFNNFLTSSTTNPIYTLTGNSSDALYSEIGCDVLTKIYNDNNILNQLQIESMTLTEEDNFNTFIGQLNAVNIEPYLFVSYLYKFWYARFVNILPLCLKEYTETVIKSTNDNVLTYSEYISIIEKLYDEAPIEDPDHPGEYLFNGSILNYNTLKSFLESYVTILPTNYLNNIATTCEIPRFSCTLYYLRLLDSFFSTTEYETYIQELLEEVFIYLRDSGHVDYNFNWYDYHEVVDIYLKTYMRYKLINDTTGTRLFQNMTDNFNNAFTRVLTNTTHLHDPFPVAGTYDITLSFPPAIDMNETFINMISGTAMQRMHQFTENMYLSVLTREIIYGAFTHFIT